MKSPRTAVWMLLVVLLGTLPSTLCAQDGQGNGIEELVIKTYALEHARASDVAGVLESVIIGNFRIVPEMRTNRLIVSAGASLHAKMVDTITTLDRPVKQAAVAPGTVTEILTPRHRPVSALLETLQMNLSRGGRIVADEARNAIVVRDEADNVRSVKALMNDLDVASRGLSLQFLILGPGGQDMSKVPDAKKVTSELESLGLSGYGIRGRAAVRSVEMSKFGAEGMFDRGMVSIDGRVRLVPDGGIAELDLRAKISLDIEVEDARKMVPAVAQITSTLRVPLGHLVVVGLAPAGGEPSEPLVLVVRAVAE